MKWIKMWSLWWRGISCDMSVLCVSTHSARQQRLGARCPPGSWLRGECARLPATAEACWAEAQLPGPWLLTDDASCCTLLEMLPGDMEKNAGLLFPWMLVDFVLWLNGDVNSSPTRCVWKAGECIFFKKVQLWRNDAHLTLPLIYWWLGCWWRGLATFLP